MMNQIMESLFSILETTQRSDSEIRSVQAAEKAVQAAQQRLTYQEFEQLWDAIMNIGYAIQCDRFTQGFRLGVQLTLEGLLPVNLER